MSDLLETFSLRCPRCRQTDELRIVVTSLALVSAAGSECIGDHEWSGESYCDCRQCGNEGTVADFTVVRRRRKRHEPI